MRYLGLEVEDFSFDAFVSGVVINGADILTDIGEKDEVLLCGRLSFSSKLSLLFMPACLTSVSVPR